MQVTKWRPSESDNVAIEDITFWSLLGLWQLWPFATSQLYHIDWLCAIRETVSLQLFRLHIDGSWIHSTPDENSFASPSSLYVLYSSLGRPKNLLLKVDIKFFFHWLSQENSRFYWIHDCKKDLCCNRKDLRFLFKIFFLETY